MEQRCIHGIWFGPSGVRCECGRKFQTEPAIRQHMSDKGCLRSQPIDHEPMTTLDYLLDKRDSQSDDEFSFGG